MAAIERTEDRMKLLVVSHKRCWSSPDSPTGYASDGGFPFQMRAISELFDATILMVPCLSPESRAGEISLAGHNLSVIPLPTPAGVGLQRKLNMFFWVFRNLPILFREVRRADAVHTPIPSDIGTIGMILAFITRKPLFVRHCGNWFVQKTMAERFWKWFMERFAGGRDVMVATGGANSPPSERNDAIQWIFSTSLTQEELNDFASRRVDGRGELTRLIIACRQERAKGTDVVIESLPHILKYFSGASLDVVGDGGSLERSKALAHSLQVSDRITFHGKVNHETVLELLRQSSLFCYPTTASEGFPKAVLEALACGLPVVTTRVSVLEQLIGTGCGVLIHEATPMAVAEAVRECLSDQKRYQVMSRQAIETAGQYSLERWRKSIGDLLSRCWGPLRADHDRVDVLSLVADQ